MNLQSNSALSTPNVSLEVKEICEKFAGFSQGSFSYSDYHTRISFEMSPQMEQWLAREDARWLIIRKALKNCKKRRISAGDISRLMNVQGVPGYNGLFDLLCYIESIWDPATSIEITDHQWLAGWDIEFCRATGDWTLVHFTLGLLRQAAEFHGQLPKPISGVETLAIALQGKGLFTRVARKIRLTPSHVRRVALGKRKSQKVTAAIREEIAQIESSSQGQADGAPRLANEETKPPAAAHVSVQGVDNKSNPQKLNGPGSPASSPRFLRATQVMAMLGVSRDTVIDLIGQSKLQGCRLNDSGWWRITPESVARLQKGRLAVEAHE
ncbi:MAG TPA: helix-turn-helix domain-containing protein [Candidatus Angelobacter sp.]|nr:helix-turn-helix domain-containing protein [Candidatus Angelobacter sp.]